MPTQPSAHTLSKTLARAWPPGTLAQGLPDAVDVPLPPVGILPATAVDKPH